jgi:CheY-like chemotaxis protein/two-component sensor histidine kinase
VRRKVEDARKRYFANVAHEIRTPLSTIQGPLEVLMGQVQDAGMQQQLAIAARSSERLGDLMNQMLDISKIDAEKYTLQVHAGSVASLMERLHEAYATQAATKNIVLEAECDAAATVYFDKDALEKVANNLMGNALKYTLPNGHVGISTSLQPNDDTALLTMRVWDNGPGIAIKDQERIFERFYRATDSTQAAGAGIGLALVRELVQLMNGTITVDSAPGKGTVFTVLLPLRIAATMPETTAAGTNGLVLIAEDDAEIRLFTAGLLQGKGYAVQGVADGAAALAAASTTLPDLIITDMMMPGMDGAAMIQALRHNEMTAHIPVIVLSARAAGEAKAEALAAGAQAYLTKPFSPAELTGIVHNQLDILRRQQEKYRQQVTNETQDVAERVQEADPFAKRCHELILEHLDDAQLSVERLAEMMHVNRSHFQRKIKALTGFSPSEMIRTIRLEKAKEMLLRREGNITETAYATGFTSQSYFTRCFSEHFGYPPSEVLHK